MESNFCVSFSSCLVWCLLVLLALSLAKSGACTEVLSLLAKVLAATWWKHLPLTSTCCKIEKSLNQSPGEKAVEAWKCSFWELLLHSWLWTCISARGEVQTCVSSQCICSLTLESFSLLIFHLDCSFPSKWMRLLNTRDLQSQHWRTVIWQVSQSGKGWSELWASKSKARVHTFTFLSRFSEQRSLSCQNHTILLASSRFSLGDISWVLSAPIPSGKRPCRTSKPEGGKYRRCLRPAFLLPYSDFSEEPWAFLHKMHHSQQLELYLDVSVCWHLVFRVSFEREAGTRKRELHGSYWQLARELAQDRLVLQGSNWCTSSMLTL